MNDENKRKRKKKTSEETFRFEALKFPPCCVCGGISSGYHFGVTTCEACKNFFRRYATNNKTFKCVAANNECIVTEKSRSSCPSCRLQKCLQVGMSKDKIKKGRLSSLNRTEIINKVKGDSNGNDKDVNGEEPIEENEKYVANDVQDFSCELLSECLSRQTIRDTTDEITIEQINNLIEAKASFLTLYNKHGVETAEQFKDACEEYASRYHKKRELFGEMSSLPFETYELMYKQYGIDLDERIASLKKEMDEFNENVAIFCNFAAKVPGFRRLVYIDQESLLKANMAALSTLFYPWYFSKDYKVLLCKYHHFHIDEWKGKFYSDYYLEKFTQLLCKVQEIKFSDVELALIGAISLLQVTSPLQNIAAVERLQESLMAVLLTEIRKVYGDKCHKRVDQTLAVLYYLKEYCEIHKEEFKHLCDNSVIADEFPVLKQFVLP